ASLDFLGVGHAGNTSNAGDSATIDIPGLGNGWQTPELSLIGANFSTVPPSSDASKTFSSGNEFAAATSGPAPRFDNVMRGGPAVPDTVWMGLTPNTDWKHGNNFEAGLTAQFVCGKKTQYPVTVRLPVYMAVNDEQYFLGPHCGYISAGINLRAPLRFISNRFGKWSVGGSADFCYYGTTTTEFVRSIGLQIPKVVAAF